MLVHAKRKVLRALLAVVAHELERARADIGVKIAHESTTARREKEGGEQVERVRRHLRVQLGARGVRGR